MHVHASKGGVFATVHMCKRGRGCYCAQVHASKGGVFATVYMCMHQKGRGCYCAHVQKGAWLLLCTSACIKRGRVCYCAHVHASKGGVVATVHMRMNPPFQTLDPSLMRTLKVENM